MLARPVFVASVSVCVLFTACGGEEFSAQSGPGGADAGGAAGAAGDGGGAGTNPGGNGGSAGASVGGAGGSDAGSGGAGGMRDGGVAGSGTAGSGTSGAGGQSVDACALQEWFPDDDQDGFGRSSGAVQSCTKPDGKFAEHGGDCNDDNQDVFPGQTKYFAQPYQTGAGAQSFDYDCSQTEEGDSSQYGAAPNNCTVLMAGGCAGQGFVPEGRSGGGINPLCGSATLRKCTWNTIMCDAVEQDVEPKRCH
ncbi:MAG: hypothetical protein AB7S68_10405 [Polyangiaceae bacterium]